MKQDLHMHTVFCDGSAAPEEMVCAAIEKGLERVGISGHSYTFFDESYCMSLEGFEKYKKELARLRAVYADRIEVLCGVEQDMFSTADTSGLDYIIGSVHYLKCGEEYLPVDEDPQTLEGICARHFGGDWYALCEHYFAQVSEVVARTGADIIGHFDLVSKFNEKCRFFDENHPRYISAWQSAAAALIKTGKPFEINTGAVSRAWRSVPYPAPPMIDYISARGGSFILSSDSHSTENICFEFDKWSSLIKQKTAERRCAIGRNRF